MGSYSSTSYGLLLTEEFGSKLPHIPDELFDLAVASERYDFFGGRLDGLSEEDKAEFEDRRLSCGLDEEDDELLERCDAGALSQEARAAFTYVNTADGPAFVLGFHVKTKDLIKPDAGVKLRAQWDQVISAFSPELQALIHQAVAASEEDPTAHVLTGRD